MHVVVGGIPAALQAPRRYSRPKHSRENYIPDVAVLVREAAAINDDALALDFDGARFGSQLIAAKADHLGHVDLAIAAAHLAVILGPVGTTPPPGYGAGMLRVANELDALGFDPL